MLSTCRKCKQIFTRITVPLCETCWAAEEEVFKKVKEYLYANPSVSINELSSATGVPPTKILTYIREGMIGLSGL